MAARAAVEEEEQVLGIEGERVGEVVGMEGGGIMWERVRRTLNWLIWILLNVRRLSQLLHYRLSCYSRTSLGIFLSIYMFSHLCIHRWSRGNERPKNADGVRLCPA